MAITSCFFSIPTLNTPISDSSPKLSFSSSFSFSGVISVKSLPFHRRFTISPLFSNIGGGGDNGGDKNGGDGDGDGGDEDRERNRNEAMMLLAETETGLETLPKDLAAAIESGRIPGSVIERFLELQKSAVMRWLMQFGGFRERLLADDLFLAKLAMECGVGVFTKTAAEYERRRENFFNELEVVFADVVNDMLLTLLR